MKDKILVTGGLGYIGSHTVVELINKDFDVVIIDDLSNSHIEILDKIEQITSVRPICANFNICDLEKLSEFASDHTDIKAVIHFAAHKAVGESVEQPVKYYRNNLNSLLNIMTMIEGLSTKNLVFSSSCSVYGEPLNIPVDENTPVEPAESPYANTKIICEDICNDFFRNIDGSCTLLRYFNPIGSHESALIGELPLGLPSNLVPVITQTAIGKREKLMVFGDDYDTPDGSCIRDYINVVDIALAHISAVKRLIANEEKSKVEIFNLGTGNGASVFEIIDSFEHVSGLKLNYEVAPRRPGDVSAIYADVKLATQELKWTAEKTLDETLLSAWKWEQHLNERNSSE